MPNCPLAHASTTVARWRRRSPRPAVVAGVAIAALAVYAVPAHADDALALHCTSHHVQVAMTDGGPQDLTISGQLCYRGPVLPQTVQLLVHGGSYNHFYWDFPYRPEIYSYVRAATGAGYATFNVDRLGAGDSSHPPGIQVDFAAGATALHDVIGKLRAGDPDIGGHAFRQVIWVGHSLGSLAGWVEVGRYHDVDAVIITGLLHALSPSWANSAFPAFYPAGLDPLFASRQDIDWTYYLTTKPGTRGGLFYQAGPTADPNVIEVDEQHKDTATVGELASYPSLLNLPPAEAPSRQITVPVLVVVGQKDSSFCAPDAVDCSSQAAVQQAEAPYYSPQAQLRVEIIPETGHTLNLHITAPAFFGVAQAWALTHVAPWAS